MGEDFDRLRVSCHHHKLRVLVAGENRKWRLKIIGTEISRTDQSTQLGTGHLQGRTMNYLVLVKVVSMHIQTYIRVEPESMYVCALNCRFYPTCNWKEYNLVY